MNNILQHIKERHIAMRPKWHFIATKALYLGCLLVLILTALLTASLILFSLRITGAWFAPQFAPRGWYILLTALPWVLICLGIVTMVAGELLVRRYAFAYRRPVLYSVLGILVLTGAGTAVAQRTRLHKRMYVATQQGRMQWVKPMYQMATQPRMRIMHRGIIRQTLPEGFTMDTQLQELLKVLTDAHTRFPQQLPIATGMDVVVMGPRQGMAIQAMGIRIMKDLDE